MKNPTLFRGHNLRIIDILRMIAGAAVFLIVWAAFVYFALDGSEIYFWRTMGVVFILFWVHAEFRFRVLYSAHRALLAQYRLLETATDMHRIITSSGDASLGLAKIFGIEPPTPPTDTTLN